MKFSKIIVVLFVLAAIPSFAAGRVQLKTQIDSISYTIGTNWGTMLKMDSLYLNLDAIMNGMEDGLKGNKFQLSETEISACYTALQAMVNERHERLQKESAKKAKDEGAKFLAENGKKKNIKTTASGLQYEVLEAGKADGKSPKETSKVKVHYVGTLLNGTKFDSSYDGGKPLEFELNRVIRGWTEGVQLMKEGAKFKFFIPGELAYGERGMGQTIGPNQTLVFEVELLEVMSDPK